MPLTVQTIPFVIHSDVFNGNDNALQAFEDSGHFSYGDNNNFSLVGRDKLIKVLKVIKEDEESEDTKDEIDNVIKVLKELDAKTYVDLES